MKILIVDDDKSMRQVLLNSLASFYTITPFESDNIADAVKIAGSEKPEIAFIDMQILNLDSNEHLEDLKNSCIEMKVVLMSDFAADERILSHALNYLKASQLTKPFRIETLKAVIDKLIFPSAPPKQSEEKIPEIKSVKEKPKKEAKEVRTKSKIKIAAIALLAAIVASSYYILQNVAPKPKEFNIDPRKNISSIAVFENRIFVTDWDSQNIFVYEVSDELKLLSTMKQDLSQPSGISTDGKYLWIADALQGTIFQFALPDFDSSVESIDFVREYPAPGPSPSGVYYDGKQLFTYDAQTRKIYLHKLDEKLTIEKSFDLFMEQPCGFGKYENNYYIADAKTNRIFRFSEEHLNLEKIFFLPMNAASETSKRKIAAFASDSRSFWAASEIGRIYRFHPSELKSVDMVR